MKEGFDDKELRRYQEFKDKISRRVGDIGAKKGSTVRGASTVSQRLYKITEGDHAKVTDPMIEAEYDAVRLTPDDKGSQDRLPDKE